MSVMMLFNRDIQLTNFTKGRGVSVIIEVLSTLAEGNIDMTKHGEMYRDVSLKQPV